MILSVRWKVKKTRAHTMEKKKRTISTPPSLNIKIMTVKTHQSQTYGRDFFKPFPVGTLN